MKTVREAPLARYVREYSALPGLQQANSVEYTLQRSENMLCFSVHRKGDAEPVRFYSSAIGEDTACKLLCYMYENSIAPEQMYDVLSDFCGKAL